MDAIPPTPNRPANEMAKLAIKRDRLGLRDGGTHSMGYERSFTEIRVPTYQITDSLN